MFTSYYKLEISGKDIKRFIKMLYKINIFFEEIYFTGDKCYVKVDKKNYDKIKKIKTSYNIEVVSLYGLKNIEKFLKDNFYFILSSLIGIFFVYLLSFLIFDIEIVHNDSYIRNLILEELSINDIKKYDFVKSYDYIQEVKKKILDNNKDAIEWIEIERIGTKYRVRVEKRILNNIKSEDNVKHIVAKKPGIIMKIVALNGEVVRKVNDYVKEGDIIISGNIYKNDEVVDSVSAEGEVYAEVWYTVKVELPISYKEESVTGNKKNVFNVKFLDNDINLFDFNPYKNKKIDSFLLFKDFFGMFSINYNKEFELNVRDEVNNIISEEFAFKLAREKINEKLSDDEYIISQKKLKTVINNSTIVTEVFFKVYENISSSQYFSIEEG